MNLPTKPLLTSCLAFIALLAGQVHAACNANIQLTKPDSIYTDNFDGTVTDTETGLVWAKCSLGQNWVDNTPNDGSDDQCSGTAVGYTWKAALAAAQTANVGNYLGQTDWRMPNKKELASLMETACENPAINNNLFPAAPSFGYFWTSSSYVVNSTDAWVINPYNGDDDTQKKQYSNHIRLVRGSY